VTCVVVQGTYRNRAYVRAVRAAKDVGAQKLRNRAQQSAAPEVVLRVQRFLLRCPASRCFRAAAPCRLERLLMAQQQKRAARIAQSLTDVHTKRPAKIMIHADEISSAQRWQRTICCDRTQRAARAGVAAESLGRYDTRADENRAVPRPAQHVTSERATRSSVRASVQARKRHSSGLMLLLVVCYDATPPTGVTLICFFRPAACSAMPDRHAC